MPTKQTNIRLEKELLEKYEALAIKEDREKTYHMKKALESYKLIQVKPSKGIKPKSIKPKEPFALELGQQFGEHLNQIDWAAWVGKRKDMKKPISSTAASSQIKMLLNYSIEQQGEIISNSIKNDYQGLFKPKQKAVAAYDDGRQNSREVSLQEELEDTSWANK